MIASKERCLRTDNWKIVFTPIEDGYTHSLYNIKNDPQCLKDVGKEKSINNEKDETLSLGMDSVWKSVLS